MTPTPPSSWEELGYRIPPETVSDLDMDYEEEQKARTDGSWVLVVKKDEADKLISELLATAKQEGVRETQERLHGEIEGKRVIGMTAEECKCCTARNQALDDLLSKLN